ncbi:MAG: glycosyl hydrolase, partial [Kiritimatiellae bacterium]|nr:glycosyl hydrolase [Kiritimatiellia bacterium]
MRGSKLLVTGLILCYAVAFGGALERMFDQPPDAARPWVYWYFMDGNMTREGMKADLEAMKAAGIGGVLILEVGLGNPPRGPVEFLSEKWLELFGFAIAEADRLGIEVAVGTGPGWCGTGGKAVKPEDAMQHTVASETTVDGPAAFSAVLPLPDPRKPFFGEGTLTPEMRNAWQTFYRDVAVLAFPDPKDGARLPDTDEKALYY